MIIYAYKIDRRYMEMASKDKSYFERDDKGKPVKFVERHESHYHDGKKPHEHEVDLYKATIGSISKGGNYNDLRKDRK